MDIYGIPVQGKSCLDCIAHKAYMQLKDPKARSFTHVELRNAMMETLAFVNKLSKEAGIVSTVPAAWKLARFSSSTRQARC